MLLNQVMNKITKIIEFPLVVLKMQIKLSIMSKKMEEMVVSSIKKCMQEILQNIG